MQQAWEYEKEGMGLQYSYGQQAADAEYKRNLQMWKDDSSLLGRRKIILTTDQDLIKDGVQAIDDEFLEWFVKNPSCEKIKINYEIYKEGVGLLTSDWRMSEDDKYKIIIPKEESELKCDFCKRYPRLEGTNKCESCYSVVRHALEQNPKFKDALLPDLRKKQETLEEAAEKLYPIHKMYFPKSVEDLNKIPRSIFISGAKWQAERSYSEEEAYKIWKAGQEYWKTSGESITFEELIEQFKKK